METITDTHDLETKALSLPEQAREIQVIDGQSLERASNTLIAIKGLRKEIDEVFDPAIKKAHDAHKSAVALKKRFEMPLAQAEAIIKPRIAAFHELQEKKRLEEEARLREEARRRAEDEQLALAQSAQAMGMTAEANAILEQPVYAPVVILPKATQSVSGISMRTVWRFRILDTTLIPREFMTPDEKKIGAYVRAMMEQARIPGIEIYKESNVAARSA